jgi:hypothetical protein
MARLHRYGDETTEVAAEQHSRGTENSREQIHMALLPVFAESAEADGGKKDQERGALRGVLVHVEQVG